jgi:hypothetical protein
MKSQIHNVLVFNNLIRNKVTQFMFVLNSLIYIIESQTLLLLLLQLVHKTISPSVPIIGPDDLVFNN